MRLQQGNVMKHRSFRGRIDYIRDGAGNSGREWFSVTVQPNGNRTLRAQCEMDDIGLLRDVVQTLDGDWLPVDSFVRLTKDGEFMGAGWFRFFDRHVECEAVTAAEGRVSQRIETQGRARILASHPLMTDGWQCAAFDHASDERTQIIKPWVNSSPRPDGGSGPLAAVGEKIIDYVGEETITVPAETFDTRHYRLHASQPEVPALETWVFGEDYQFAKMRWDLLSSDYVLAEYQADNGP